MTKINLSYLFFFFVFAALMSCEKFEDFSENPNEPTQVSAEVLLPGAIRQSITTAVNASFLVGNNIAQLSAKTFRLDVDAYRFSAFPTFWEAWYESLTDVLSVENIAKKNGNEQLEGAVIVLRTWIFQNLTNAYGNVPYFEATKSAEDNFTPVYDNQEVIYNHLLSELDRAATLLQGSGSIEGDILLGGNKENWLKFANSLQLRLLLYAGDKVSGGSTKFANIVNSGNILSSNEDNVALTYTGIFPNEFPLIPLRTGDADAVVIADAAVNVMKSCKDPRLFRYTRPNNDDFSTYDEAQIIGAINGQGAGCSKNDASRIGLQYYNYPTLKKASSFGLSNADGVVMTYAEMEFILAEAIAKGWISGDIEAHYKNGIAASMTANQVDLAPFGWTDFEDFYINSGVAYQEVKDIWEQKWLALFFHGLEPYFEVRRWYVESGNSFDGIPFLSAACGNINSDNLPLRFLYPGEEQSLNAQNYEAAVKLYGGNSQNAKMWLVE